MFAILLAIFLEYACLPLPSEVILPLAGALSCQQSYNIFVVILLTTLVGYLGTLICYIFGYYGGYCIINKLSKTKANKGINCALYYFHSNEKKAICLGRMIPLCRTYISFVAGTSRQNFIKYTLFSFIGIFIWNTILILLGFYFADNLDFIVNIYKKYQLIIVILLMIFLLFLFIKWFLKKKNNKIKTFWKREK